MVDVRWSNLHMHYAVYMYVLSTISRNDNPVVTRWGGAWTVEL